MNAPEVDDWTSKRASVNILKQAQVVRALTPSFSPKDGVGKKTQLPRFVENKAQSANSPPAGQSMTAGGDKMASQRHPLSSLHPSLSDGPVVLSATTGFIGTKSSSSEKDEIYPRWADESSSQWSPEGDSSNASLNASEDDVFSAARTVVGDPQQPENGYVLGLHAVPVQGQGSSGIGISFRPVEGGAQVRPCWRFPSACASFALYRDTILRSDCSNQ